MNYCQRLIIILVVYSWAYPFIQNLVVITQSQIFRNGDVGDFNFVKIKDVGTKIRFWWYLFYLSSQLSPWSKSTPSSLTCHQHWCCQIFKAARSMLVTDFGEELKYPHYIDSITNIFEFSSTVDKVCLLQRPKFIICYEMPYFLINGVTMG